MQPSLRTVPCFECIAATKLIEPLIASFGRNARRLFMVPWRRGAAPNARLARGAPATCPRRGPLLSRAVTHLSGGERLDFGIDDLMAAPSLGFTQKVERHGGGGNSGRRGADTLSRRVCGRCRPSAPRSTRRRGVLRPR